MAVTTFDNRVVLITAAGCSLGRALALAFAGRGARVAANDLTPINLDETIALVQTRGGDIRAYLYDVAKKMPVQALIEAVRDDWGRLDMVIHNAVVQPHAAVLEMDEWDWRRTIDVNLAAAFFIMQAAGRVMRDQGGGVIINLTENPASDKIQPGWAAVQASQAGLLELTRVAAVELKPLNVAVHAIALTGYPASYKWAADEPPFVPDALIEARHDPVSLALYLASPRAASLQGDIYRFHHELN